MVHEKSDVTFFLSFQEMQKNKNSSLILRRFFSYLSILFILECPKGTRKPDEIVNTSLSFHQVFTQCHVYY